MCEEGALPGTVRLKPYQGRCPDEAVSELWRGLLRRKNAASIRLGVGLVLPNKG